MLFLVCSESELDSIGTGASPELDFGGHGPVLFMCLFHVRSSLTRFFAIVPLLFGRGHAPVPPPKV